MPNSMKTKIMQIFKNMGSVPIIANYMKTKIRQIFRNRGSVPGFALCHAEFISASQEILKRVQNDIFQYFKNMGSVPSFLRNAGVAFMTPEISKKADVVADLGLHYMPSNPEWKHFRTEFGNRNQPTKVGDYRSRNQPTKVGDYRPSKWAMAVGYPSTARSIWAR